MSDPYSAAVNYVHAAGEVLDRLAKSAAYVPVELGLVQRYLLAAGDELAHTYAPQLEGIRLLADELRGEETRLLQRLQEAEQRMRGGSG